MPHRNRWLLSIVVAGLFLRVAMAFYLGDRVEPIPPAYDQIYFHDVALNLLAGKGFAFTNPPWPFIQAGAPTAYVSFIYNLYVAGIYAVLGPHPLAVRVIQALICSLMPWQMYLLASRIADSRRLQNVVDGGSTRALALVAAGISAGYAYFVYFSATLMTEGFYLVAVVWVLDLTLKLAGQPSVRRWAAWGLAVALASLLRQVFMPVAALLFVYILWKTRGRIKIGHLALAGAIAAVLILPWTARNYLVFGRFLLLNSQAGQIFWNANHPDLGTRFQGSPMFDIPADLQGLNEVDLSNELLRRGLGFVAADPWRFVRLSLSRALEFFRFWPAPGSSVFNNVARTVSFTICLPFMVAGLVISVRAWRRWVLLYMFIIFYTLIHIVSWPGIRYRLPVDVALVPFSALFIVSLLQWLREHVLVRSKKPSATNIEP